ncbi:helix-turn-helix domain-containing protein [Deinococcus peraridilitoris]|uniref:Helix-turn-helix domain-containing protein n=1 Tax=Deinococcus peraridilitoris (strain DSM 19664 / LMG 22246 / CIP 109416 / KR-200) TaxID=937777 RepID=K9ZZJ1_DEIPD|nr:helix-turn-helix domain-containing protein [Deinococcus peraridilitoris]AFZ67021.1 hypothetical protein Deipe_1480 [Deinococcus peraridilitoris DSM 19664]
MSLDELIAEQVQTAVARVVERHLERLALPATQSDLQNDTVFTVPELAAYLRVGKNAAYALCNQTPPPFPVRRIAGRVVISKRAVDRWLEAGDEPLSGDAPRVVFTPAQSAPRGVKAAAPLGRR